MDKAIVRNSIMVAGLLCALPTFLAAQPWEDMENGPIGFVYSTATDSEHLIMSDGLPGRQPRFMMHRYDGNEWEHIEDEVVGIGANPISALCLFSGTPYCYHYGSGLEGIFMHQNGSWQLIGPMISGGKVWGMKVYADTLYIYGQFRDINGDTTLRHIVKYDGEQFHPVAAPLFYSPNISPIVKDIHFYQGDLYVVGDIRTASGKYHIARWDGAQWQDVGEGFPYNTYPSRVVEYNGLLLVNSRSLSYNGITNGMVAWDGQQFHGMGDGACEGVAGLVHVAVHEGRVFISGTCNYPVQGWENYLAAFDGERWCRYPGTEEVRHMTSFQGDMFANLMHAEQPGNIPVYRFARWMEDSEPDWCGEFVNVGIPESGEEETAISVFPNPTTGPLTITSTKPLLSVAVVDMLGRVLLSERGNGSNSMAIDLSHLPAGIYVVQVETEAGRWAQRVVRE